MPPVVFEDFFFLFLFFLFFSTNLSALSGFHLDWPPFCFFLRAPFGVFTQRGYPILHGAPFRVFTSSGFQDIFTLDCFFFQKGTTAKSVEASLFLASFFFKVSWTACFMICSGKGWYVGNMRFEICKSLCNPYLWSPLNVALWAENALHDVDGHIIGDCPY